MNKLYYQPKGFWFGDCMPFGKGDSFYLFHQRDKRNPCPLFGEPFGWSLATTKDFVHYEDKGIAIQRGSDIEQDQFIFAGSIFEDRTHVYHAFYTGYNRDYPRQGKPAQVLLEAKSRDLEHWEKEKGRLSLEPQKGYDKNDWRDPFVLWDEEHQEYLLILGGRKLDGDRQLNGCTVHFVSQDLKNWVFKGPFYAPNLFTMQEMPDLFKIGDWWYLIVSEYSNKNKILYRMSKSIYGPWLTPEDDAFDGRAYYAGRTFSLHGQRILFGWVPTRENCDDTKNFEWGGTFVPYEIIQRVDGTLGVKLPDSIPAAFNTAISLGEHSLRADNCRKELTLGKSCGDIYMFEADVKLEDKTQSFALQFYRNDRTCESYQFKFLVSENRFIFEKIPNQPWFQCMNIGLERPMKMSVEKTYHLRLIVDDTLATIFLGDIAMNTRMYKRPGDTIGISVTNGFVKISHAKISKELKKR
jgi:beta-fructofuranosidase